MRNKSLLCLIAMSISLPCSGRAEQKWPTNVEMKKMREIYAETVDRYNASKEVPPLPRVLPEAELGDEISPAPVRDSWEPEQLGASRKELSDKNLALPQITVNLDGKTGEVVSASFK